MEVLHGKCIQISQHGCPRLIYLTEAGNIRGGHPVSLGLLFACRQISSELLSFSTAHLPLTYNYYLSTGEHAFTTDMISVTHRQRARELQIHVSARRPRQNHNVPRREKIDHLIQNLPRLEKIEMHFSYLWNQATMNADPGCLGANLYYDLLTGMIQSVHSGASDRLEQSLCGPSASAKLLDTLHDYRQWLKTLRDAMSQAGHETRELTTGVHIDFIRWEYVSLDTDVHYQVEAVSTIPSIIFLPPPRLTDMLGPPHHGHSHRRCTHRSHAHTTISHRSQDINFDARPADVQMPSL